MNHDSKKNEFEYEKENFPKTPEHFKQLVAAQVEKELNQTSVATHRPRKKWFPAKVAAAVIVCAAVGTTGAYAGVKQYQAKSQEYLQETGRISTTDDAYTGSTTDKESSDAAPSSSSTPATIVSEGNGLITTFSDTWPDVMLEMYDYDSEYQKQPNQYMNIIDAYYDGGLLSIYGEATPYGIKTLGDWFLPDRIVINDTVYLAQWSINGLPGTMSDAQYKRGAFHATVELSDANLPDTCKVQVPLTTSRDPKTGYFYMQTISFDISGNANVKPATSAYTASGAEVTIAQSKISASGTYLDLTWNFGQDYDSFKNFDQVMNDDNIHNWVFCKITDSNGNTYDTQTENAAFHSSNMANDSDDGGERAYTDDNGNYCFRTQVVIPTMTQDFTSLEVTPYIHLEDGTETDLDFASFQVEYK